MMNDDDDPPSHFMIQSSLQVWSAVRGPPPVANFVWKPETAAHRTEPNWIQTNLATKRRNQTGGLI